MSTQFFRIVPILLLILFCSSCATTKPADITPDAGHNPMGGTKLLHAYQPIIKGKEPIDDDYGMYTYVLMATKLKVEDKNKPRGKRFRNLFKHIRGLRPASGTIKEKKFFNLFLCPSKIPKFRPDVSEIKQYDFQFSQEILEDVFILLNKSWPSTEPEAKDFRRRLSDHEGPFLISMEHPIKADNSNESIIFADLSKFDSKTIDTILNEYKKQLKTGGRDIKKFESMKLNFLNWLAKLDKSGEKVSDSIKILNSALAKE